MQSCGDSAPPTLACRPDRMSQIHVTPLFSICSQSSRNVAENEALLLDRHKRPSDAVERKILPGYTGCWRLPRKAQQLCCFLITDSSFGLQQQRESSCQGRIHDCTYTQNLQINASLHCLMKVVALLLLLAHLSSFIICTSRLELHVPNTTSSRTSLAIPCYPVIQCAESAELSVLSRNILP